MILEVLQNLPRGPMEKWPDFGDPPNMWQKANPFLAKSYYFSGRRGFKPESSNLQFVVAVWPHWGVLWGMEKCFIGVLIGVMFGGRPKSACGDPLSGKLWVAKS